MKNSDGKSLQNIYAEENENSTFLVSLSDDNLSDVIDLESDFESYNKVLMEENSLDALFIKNIDSDNESSDDLYKKLSADKFGVYLIKSGYWNNQLIYSLRDFGYVILSAVVVSLFFMFLVWITKGKE